MRHFARMCNPLGNLPGVAVTAICDINSGEFVKSPKKLAEEKKPK